MLWNWYTVDACFLAESWHIRSPGMFAGSCIGVILLVVSLEFLRRAGKEYDRFVIRQHVKQYEQQQQGEEDCRPLDGELTRAQKTKADAALAAMCSTEKMGLQMSPFRPSAGQQAVRALLHMLQFAVAYFIML